MASATQKAMGDASAGAGVGFMVGGPIGAGIGAGVGGLFGYFSGDDPAITSPTYADINLAQDNPVLYAKLQQQGQLLKEAQSIYDARRSSITPYEAQQYREYMSNAGNRLNGLGLAGTSVGISSMNDADAKYRNQVADRIFNERNAAFGTLGQASQNDYNNTRMALGDVMSARRNSQELQENMNSANNQMYSSLFTGGLGMLGSAYNANQMASAQAGRPQFYGGGLPQGFSYGVPGQGIQYAPQGPLSGTGAILPGSPVL